MTKPVRKKLIEVALPLEAINSAAALEKEPFTRNHPRSIHIWWARRPLTAARAVIFAQMVDDPSSWPDLFPTEKKQEKERQRLFKIIEELVQWENTTNEEVLQKARDEIWRSWRRTCAENADHPQAKELFDRDKLPGFHDPFAGGGALPLEAQRLGLESYASDLNPVAVLINKAMIEIPPKFAGQPPVNPDAQARKYLSTWTGAQGLAEDVRYYGQWMRDEAEKRIGHLYPKVKITKEMVAERPDLKQYEGKDLTVIAWIWARTVKSPNPAFRDVDVPLASTFMLSTKKGKEAYVKPLVENGGYRFVVKVGQPKDADRAKRGTKSGGSGTSFLCLMSDAPIPFEYIRPEAKAGRMGARLMAIVAEGDRGRVYLTPTEKQEELAKQAVPNDPPDSDLPPKALGFRVQEYGMTKWRDLFTPRQLAALTTLSDLVAEAREKVYAAANAIQHPDPEAYSDAIATYLGLSSSRWADLSNTICSWNNTNQNVRALFSRQAIPMNWDYSELSPFSKVGSWFSTVESILAASQSLVTKTVGVAAQYDAATQVLSQSKVVSTDPPYYDNIGYADLSDFFYAWLRRSLRSIHPPLFATIAVPKTEELVATPYRHASRDAAEKFFLDGMTEAMEKLCQLAHPSFPVTIYYAFKQSETTDAGGQASTGWETFLEAVIRSGFTLTGTWPMRTERGTRSVGLGTNALASSIVLVCRRREVDAPTATRREFLTALQNELPKAIGDLQRGNVAPVDMQQAAIGPGMAVFTRYAKVLAADGKPLSVRDALTMINQALDEVLAEQEGDFDSDTRWALSWFEQFGFSDGDYGDAETLSKAKNTSVNGIVEAGIAVSGKGKVRLLKPEELPESWTPEGDKRLTVWDMVHHLIRVLAQGEPQAAQLMAKLGSKAETARELAYRLYAICDRTKRSQDAQRYNGLVQSWPEIAQMAQQVPKQAAERQQSFEGME
jgi:putative DNA methylase